MNIFVIRDQRRPLRTTRREQGFVQGVLLFALAVLVAIIAAFAFANNGSQGSAERENAKVTATVLMKQASDVQDAVGRYIADAQGLKYLCVTSGVSSTQQVDGTSLVAPGNLGGSCGTLEVDLWTSSLGYITPPKAPSAAFASSADAAKRAWGYANFSADGRAGLETATAPGYYAFMEAANLDRKVCQAINRLIGLDFPYTAATAGTETEMCYSTTGTGSDVKYTYRKVIASRK